MKKLINIEISLDINVGNLEEVFKDIISFPSDINMPYFASNNWDEDWTSILLYRYGIKSI